MILSNMTEHRLFRDNEFALQADYDMPSSIISHEVLKFDMDCAGHVVLDEGNEKSTRSRGGLGACGQTVGKDRAVQR